MDKIFASDKKALVFVWVEAFLIFSIILQIFMLVGIKVTKDSLSFFQRLPSFELQLLFITSIIFYAIIYFTVVNKNNKIKKFHLEFSKLLMGTAKQKFLGVDRKIIAIFFIEIIFAVIIAVAIYIYLDPEVNVVPWPFNYLVFLLFVGFGLYIFSQTKDFREMVYGPSFVRKKIRPAERLFPTRRLTNVKTGSVRVSKKKNKKGELRK